jgi:carboxyl-terminal processing protease
MFQRLFIVFLFIAILFPDGRGQESSGECRQIQAVAKALSAHHFSPNIPTDTENLTEWFALFMRQLDPSKLIITQAQTEQLKADFLSSPEDSRFCSLFQAAVRLLSERMEPTRKILEEISTSPFSLTQPVVRFTARAETPRELTQRWENHVQKQVTEKLIAYFPADVKADQAKKVKQAVVDMERLRLEKMRAGGSVQAFVAAKVSNALALWHDPHTWYLSKDDFNRFQRALDVSTEGFGFEIDENQEGASEITGLAPGGPAWKSNQMHEGDILLKWHWEGEAPIDLSLFDLDDITELVDSEKQSAVLTLRKKNGMEVEVALNKETLRSDENLVVSYLLQGPQKVGYIALPSFYTDFGSGDNVRGSATDLAREVVKLKREKITGLILDLRSNGGGSMLEAVNLAGIFIDEGPLFMEYDGKNKPSLHRDMNRGTIYDGPLVVLVNRASASASELVASVLQDYNRAIIVGSPTYGKATAQTLLPVTFLTGKTVKEAGYMKITYGKFYRVTGASIQQKGVVPDIILPDVLDALVPGEAKEARVLANDSVDRKPLYKSLKPIPIAQLRTQHTQRLSASVEFGAMQTLMQEVQTLLEEPKKYELRMEDIRAHRTRTQTLQDKYLAIKASGAHPFEVGLTSYYQTLLNFNENERTISEKRVEEISTDIFLKEAYQIITDFIHLTQK